MGCNPNRRLFGGGTGQQIESFAVGEAAAIHFIAASSSSSDTVAKLVAESLIA